MSADLIGTDAAADRLTIDVHTESGDLVRPNFSTKALAQGCTGPFDCDFLILPTDSVVAANIVLDWMTDLVNSGLSDHTIDIASYIPDNLSMAEKKDILALFNELDFKACRSFGPHDAAINSPTNRFNASDLNIVDDKIPKSDANKILIDVSKATVVAVPESKQKVKEEEVTGKDHQVNARLRAEWEDVVLQKKTEIETWGLVHRGTMVVVEEIEILVEGEISDDDDELI